MPVVRSTGILACAGVIGRKMPPQLNGVLETALYVDDIPRSVRFYETLLGLTLIDSSERLCAMGVAGRQLLLLCKKGASGDHDGSGNLHLAFAIAAPELEAWESWLAANGVDIESRRTWPRGGRSIYFRDPDRHLLEIATPGVWPAVY